MSDPKKQQQQSDGLDLEAETVKDLDVSEEQADQLWGGNSGLITQPSGASRQA